MKLNDYVDFLKFKHTLFLHDFYNLLQKIVIK